MNLNLTDALPFLDVAAGALVLLMAYLSRRLGEALKIIPLYRGLYGASIILMLVFILDISGNRLGIPRIEFWALLLRSIATIGSLGIAFIYWKWLFGEFFNARG